MRSRKEAQELEFWSCVPDTASGYSMLVDMATVDPTSADHSFILPSSLQIPLVLVLVQRGIVQSVQAVPAPQRGVRMYICCSSPHNSVLNAFGSSKQLLES